MSDNESEREYPVDGYDHTVTCLEFSETVELQTCEDWKAAVRLITSIDGFYMLLYSYDLDHPRRLITVVRWQQDSAKNAKVDAIDSAWRQMTILTSPPRSHHLALGRGLTTYLQAEIYVLKGNGEVIKPELLNFAYDLDEATVPALSSMPQAELAFVTYGVNPLQDDGTRTIAFVLHFIDGSEDERVRFKDPQQSSYGGAERYVEMIASPLKQWQDKGATVDIYAVQLQLWLFGS